MRMTQAVRIGGGLALLSGLAFVSSVHANTLSYYYGYSSPALAAWQSSDSYGSQNVSFVPFTPMVTGVNGGSLNAFAPLMSGVNSGTLSAYNSVGGMQTSYSAFSNVASVYGYSSGLSSTSGYQNLVSNGYTGMAYSPMTTVLSNYGMVSSTPSSYLTANTSGNLSAWFSTSTTASFSPNIISSGSYAPVSFGAPVVSNFTAPVPSTPPIVSPTTNPITPPLILDSPEPGTILLVTGGLAGLLFLRRRRASN